MLGDALSRIDHPAASFCHLLSMDDNIFASGRVSLLAGKDFIARLRLTEMYEAIRHATNPSFSLVHLYPMKLVYATLLADFGHLSLALRHCNALGSLFKKTHCKDTNLLGSFESLLNRLEVASHGNPR